MTTRKHQSNGFLWALVAVLALGAANGEAAERKFQTPLGTIVINAVPEWKDVEPVPYNLHGIAFHVGDKGRTMQFILATVDEQIDAKFTADECRELAELMRKEEIKDNLVVSDRIVSLAGAQFAGGYYKIRGRKSEKVGDYEHGYSGVISAGSAPLVFTISWNEGGQAAADRALTALKGLRLQTR